MVESKSGSRFTVTAMEAMESGDRKNGDVVIYFIGTQGSVIASFRSRYLSFPALFEWGGGLSDSGKCILQTRYEKGASSASLGNDIDTLD